MPSRDRSKGCKFAVAENGDVQSRPFIEKAVERYEDNLFKFLQNLVAKAKHKRV